MKSRQKAFSLMEWLIIAVSFSILAVVVVIPRYQNYLLTLRLKEKFAVVIKATAPFKTAIELCASYGTCVKSGALAGLEEGTQGIPLPVPMASLAWVAVAPNGTITAIATKTGGLAGETYVLTPTYVKGAPLTWAVGGTCKIRADGAIC